MEIFNIGIPELLFILVIMLVFLGPEGMASSARTLGRAIRKIIHSPAWSEFLRVNQEFQELPTRIVREAGIEDFNREISDMNQQVRSTIPSDAFKILPDGALRSVARSEEAGTSSAGAGQDPYPTVYPGEDAGDGAADAPLPKAPNP